MLKKSIKGSALIMTALLISACNKVDDVEKVPAPEAVIISGGEIEKGGECANLSPWGYPQHFSGDTLLSKQFLCHKDYALLYNSSTGVSDWIVEKITKEKIDSNYPYIEDNYRKDPALHDENAITPDEYDISNKKGWVKGIMTGVGDYKYTKKSQSQAYYMTNVAPMNPYMYQYGYSLLNKNIRNWVRMYGDMYVVTLPIYYQNKPLDFLGNKAISALKVEGKKASLGESGKARIAVPTHYAKVIFSPKLKQMMVYVIPNQPFDIKSIPSYRTTLWNVEQLTGYRFFNQFPADFKKQLINQVSGWPINYNIVEKFD